MFQQKDTALIGLIVMGASASIEKAFHKNVPDRVQITTTRVPFGEVSYNGFLEVTRKLPDAASLLMDAQPDVIAITNLIGGCIRGSEIINTLQQITGVPVLMPAFELSGHYGRYGPDGLRLFQSFPTNSACWKVCFLKIWILT